jgi:hypothetical protein
MGWLRQRLYDSAARALTKPRGNYPLLMQNDLAALRSVVHKGDVVLVDGDQRVSEVIKYLTQSSWSHSAIYVGDELWRRFPERRAELTAKFGADAQHLMIEALMDSGVIASPLSKYVAHNIRVCRPRGLRPEHCQRVVDEVIAEIGFRYDVKHVLDLARYFFPVSLIPKQLRRAALDLGSGLTTQVICSSMIARAFHNVGFPILPQVTPSTDPVAPRRWHHRLRAPRDPYPHLFRRERPTCVTPRDFDLSPWFDVVKWNAIETRQFDYRRIRWG